MAVIGDGIEIKFAQKLAGNEKEGRDKALRKLKKWIQLRSAPISGHDVFTELELLKLWKGLFFCMWMSDKPLVQEQLAEELARLVLLFPRCTDALVFVKTFFTTMAREWNGIDNIRRDKFMMLVRRVLRHSLQLGADADWTAPVLEELISIYRAAFARPEDPASLSLGLQMHCVDIFLEEVAKVSQGDITAEQLAQFLQPFVQVLKVSRETRLTSAITTGVFYHLMRQTDLGITHDAAINGELPLDGDSGEESAEEEGDATSPAPDTPLDPRAGGVDVTLPQLPVDCTQLSEMLTAAGGDPDVRQKNREALYRLATQFRDLSEGTYPLAVKVPGVIESDSELSDDDIQAAVQRLKRSETLPAGELSGRKKRRRASPVDTAEGGNSDDDEVSAPPIKKRKKLRNKTATGSGIIDAGERMMAEAENVEAKAEEGEAKEVGKEAVERPDGKRKQTLKEKRKRKLEEMRLAQEKKQKRKELKQEKLNGDVGVDGDDRSAVVNAATSLSEVADNGVSLDTVETKKKKKKKQPGDSSPGSTAAVTTDAEQRQAHPVQAASPSSASKKQKKKKVQNTEGISESNGDAPPSGKKKKKTNKMLADEASNDAPSLVSANDTNAPSAVQHVNGSVASESLNSAKRKSKKRKSKLALGSVGDTSSLSPADKSGKTITGSDEVSSPCTPQPSAALDWSIPASDDWGEPAPGEVDIFIPSKKALKKRQKTGKVSQVAHFVPSNPTAAFVKTRGSPKTKKPARPKQPNSPETPKAKKLKICLNKNQEQSFRQHLITVRNSPGVPHDPNMKPAKGLLKTPVKTPVKGVKTYLKKTRLASSPPQRSHAADFFNQ